VKAPARVAIRVLPRDGFLAAGSVSFRDARRSGSAAPERKSFAFSNARSARLLVRTETSGESTRIGKLAASVEEARRRRAPLVVLADRVAGHFVIAALALAAFTFGFWFFVDPERAVDHAVALLVVTREPTGRRARRMGFRPARHRGFTEPRPLTGLIGPLIAAVLMPLSSLTVVTSSFRARTFGGRP
jgi:cation transport ATPase